MSAIEQYAYTDSKRTENFKILCPFFVKCFLFLIQVLLCLGLQHGIVGQNRCDFLLVYLAVNVVFGDLDDQRDHE